MNSDIQFFYDNAGYSYMPGIESRDVARHRNATKLAWNERAITNGPYWIDVVPDPTPWDGDYPYDGPLWVVSLMSCSGSIYADMLTAIGGVACERDDPYLRVVAAELAQDYFRELSD